MNQSAIRAGNDDVVLVQDKLSTGGRRAALSVYYPGRKEIGSNRFKQLTFYLSDCLGSPRHVIEVRVKCGMSRGCRPHVQRYPLSGRGRDLADELEGVCRVRGPVRGFGVHVW